MFTRSLSIFFTLLFMATIIAPSVLLFVDDSIEVSVFFDFSEEEEEKTKEKDKVETFLADNDSDLDSFFEFEVRKPIGYFFKKYPKPHLNLISPPPEFI